MRSATMKSGLSTLVAFGVLILVLGVQHLGMSTSRAQDDGGGGSPAVVIKFSSHCSSSGEGCQTCADPGVTDGCQFARPAVGYNIGVCEGDPNPTKRCFDWGAFSCGTRVVCSTGLPSPTNCGTFNWCF